MKNSLSDNVDEIENYISDFEKVNGKIHEQKPEKPKEK